MLICETARLLIRRLSLDDLPALSGILSNPEVMKHSVRGVCDEAATRRFVEWSLSCYDAHGVGPWALVDKESSALIGFCGIAPERVGNADEVNLGYRLARERWGRGFATEATRAVLTYGFGIREYRSIVAIIEPDHVASWRVVEKAGFCRFQEADFHGKRVRLYRLTRTEWSEWNASPGNRILPCGGAHG